MHLSQLRDGAGFAVVAREGAAASVVAGAESTYALAMEAARSGRGTS